MKKTLLELVEFLKSHKLVYAVFSWSSKDRFSDWFVLSEENVEDYQDAVAALLREHYPEFDNLLGTYGDVYVYDSGKVSIVLTKRVYGEEYHRKDIDLSSTHSSVG